MARNSSKDFQQNQSSVQVARAACPITLDIWLHIADHIEPEDVQRFALICTTTASIVQRRVFWLKLYNKYCSAKSKAWNLKLPAHLQHDGIANETNFHRLRYNVIQSLFCCHDALREKEYSLEFLIGRAYVASWFLRYGSTILYKFSLNTTMAKNTNLSAELLMPETLTNSLEWEELYSDENNIDTSKQNACNFSNRNDNVLQNCLLVIRSQNVIPFPLHQFYNGDSPVRVAAARTMLSNDMRSYNLELDFIDAGCCKTTVKYANVMHKVIPCWRSDYMKYRKYE